ncbi:MAG: hypothetical protein IKY04_08915, partial [Lachnospiraceae bacterium]|nr:hypothetical protein [Lachnospiraceae bacterium]
KAKGIDSNSCPDIEVYNSTSFDNVGANVALYTNDTANTAFSVNGVMSYRKAHKDVSETLKLKGTQNKDTVYGNSNFYWNGGKSTNKDDLEVLDSWFVSLEAPYANANNPYAVAAGMRGEDGRINLGSFLKLSDEGKAALSAAGMDYKNLLAVLDDNYEALADQSQIKGSVSESGNTGNTDNNNSQSGTSQGSAAQSGSSQSSASDGNVSSSETSQGTASQNTTPHNERPGRGDNTAPADEEKEDAVQNAEELTAEVEQAEKTQIIEDSETAKTDSISDENKADTVETVAAIPADTKKFPAVPVIIVTGVALVLAGVIAAAAKKGILAKILADLHIVK